MKITRLTALFIAFVFAVSSAGAALAADAMPTKHSVKKPGLKKSAGPLKTVFDASHNEIFSPVKEGQLHYSSFYGAFAKAGEEVGLNQSPVTLKKLERVKTYVIAGPSKPFSQNEIKALGSFVENGGNLLVMLHISSPVAQLTESFGVIVSNFVISEKTDIIDGQSQDFLVTRFSQHPVTTSLSKVAVFGTWGLMADEGATVVASTSAQAWADLNRDRAFEEGEPVQEFGIIAVSQRGKGKVVVVADDAPFANKFIGEADNRKLAENIIMWFRQ